jgi:hypothetical protein
VFYRRRFDKAVDWPCTRPTTPQSCRQATARWP